MRSLDLPLDTWEELLAGLVLCSLPFWLESGLNKLFRFCHDGSKHEDIHWVEVPVKDLKKPKHRTTMRIPFVLAHEMLHYLADAFSH